MVFIGTMLITGCSTQVSDSDISNQVHNALNTFGCGPTSFTKEFDIVSISVKDKMVKDKNLTAIFNITVRAKRSYKETGGGCWGRFFKEGSSINQGETKTLEGEFKFNKFDKGWRIVE